MNLLFAFFIVLIVLALLYLFLIMPNLNGREVMPFLVNKNIAHRGLHNKSEEVAENSLPSAKLAAQAGYPIELDVRLTKDEVVIVFHDDTVDRVTDQTGRVESFTLDEIQKLSLEGTNHTIPTFKDFLQEVDGQVPLVIEFKNDFNNPLLCKKSVELLSDYKGKYVVKSFQPDIVLWFKKNHPNIIRGQLATKPQKGTINPILAFLSSHMVMNFLTKPHFISYDLRYSNNLAFVILKSLGAMCLIWTARSPEDLEKAKSLGVDGIIFENISPTVSFKTQKEELVSRKKQAVPTFCEKK